MADFSLPTIAAYVSSKTRLDKGTKHNCTEIIRGTHFLTAHTALSPYLSMQSRVILFKKLDLWQAQYHTTDVVRVFGLYDYPLLVPTTSLPVTYGVLDGRLDTDSEAFYKKTKLDPSEFDTVSRNIIRQLRMGKKNEEELSALIDHKSLSDILAFMLRSRIIAAAEPLGWHGDNFKYDLFENAVPKMKILAPDMAEKAFILDCFSRFAPMTVADIAHFTTIPADRVQQVIDGTDSTTMTVDGIDGELLIPKDELNNLKQFTYADSRIIVNLLPAFDSYLYAYTDPARFAGSPLVAKNPIMVNGLLAGTWALSENSIKLDVESNDPHVREHILHEARFLPNLFGQDPSDWTFKM